MPIVMLKDLKTDRSYFLEWSEITDAPNTYGMSKKIFISWYTKTYGTASYKELMARLARAEKTGSSSMITDLEGLIATNRAGENEAQLTYDELLKKYCLEAP